MMKQNFKISEIFYLFVSSLHSTRSYHRCTKLLNSDFCLQKSTFPLPSALFPLPFSSSLFPLPSSLRPLHFTCFSSESER